MKTPSTFYTNLFKKSEKTEVEKPKKEEQPVESEKAEEKPEIVKKQYEVIDRKAGEIEHKKNKTLLRIRREQEKQRERARK